MRLIDADALMERMREQAGCRACNSYDGVRCRACTWNDAIDLADEAPTINGTVDAVPVVRCKECVFWLRDEEHGSNGECECGCNDGWWLPEDYCSCGERMDVNATG